MPDTPQHHDESSILDRPVLQTRDLSFQWDRNVTALAYPDLTLECGDHLFLQGTSGSGKSTLLSLLAGLVLPRSGKLTILGQDLASLSAGQRDTFRADHIGVIFQQFNLVPYLSTLNNVLLPCRLSRKRRGRVQHSEPAVEAAQLLESLGLTEEFWRRPVTKLSVGQQQRVAAARALIGAPELILADEPTSALDTDNRDRFIELLLAEAAKQSSSVVFVSHDPVLADRFQHQVTLGTNR